MLGQPLRVLAAARRDAPTAVDIEPECVQEHSMFARSGGSSPSWTRNVSKCAWETLWDSGAPGGLR